MGPRMTAQQGVELLKIHQLRRENAAIYQQLQCLRDAVSDIKDEHETFRTQTQKTTAEFKCVKTSLSEQRDREHKLKADVEMLFQGKDEMETSLVTLRNENKVHYERIDGQYDELDKRTRSIEAGIKEHIQGQERSFAELHSIFDRFQEEIVHKAEVIDVNALHCRLSEIEETHLAATSQSKTTNTILVQRSGEDETVQLETIQYRPGGSIQQQYRRNGIRSSPDSLFDDPDKITETASYDESELLVKMPDTDSRACTSLDRMDLDMSLDASSADSSVGQVSPVDSLMTIPYPEALPYDLPTEYGDTLESISSVPCPRTPKKSYHHLYEEYRSSPTKLDQKFSTSSPLVRKSTESNKAATNRRKPLLLAASPLQAASNSSSSQNDMHMQDTEPMPPRLSPYNPRPRLVSSKTQPRTSNNEPSDISMELPPVAPARTQDQPPLPSMSRSAMSHGNNTTGPPAHGEHKRKRKRLPRRPEIPILSTSVEADAERYSRWCSP